MGIHPQQRQSQPPLPEMRTRSSGRPRAARTSEGIEAWLMKHGMEMSDTTFPKLTVILNSCVSRHTISETAESPVMKERMEPPLVACRIGGRPADSAPQASIQSTACIRPCQLLTNSRIPLPATITK